MPHPLLIATGNAHKAEEIGAILRGLLSGFELRVLSLADFPGVAEAEETGATFLENAIIKAHHYARETGEIALADDSGLEIDALDGRPGVKSARYAETSEGRIARVLEEMRGVPPERRAARFVCVAALADPAGGALAREGRVEGRIAEAPRGAGGFGYDPIFIPLAEDERSGSAAPRTLAEYSSEEKNGISHRGGALRAIAESVRRLLESGRFIE